MEAGPDLMSVGQHCSVPDCKQRDFLPFVCDCCHQHFCLDHRTYERHACPSAMGKQTETIVCPICAKAVRCDGRDPNMAFEAHSRQDCDPSNYDRVHRKTKCPVLGCKEKLTTINTYRCKDCNINVCLKHRFPSDHRCKPAAGPPQLALVPTLRKIWNSQSVSKQPLSSQSASSVKSAPPAVSNRSQSIPGNSLKETAFRRQAAAEGRLKQASGTGGPERCPVCNAGFYRVEELIEHCEVFHSDGCKERCPQCGFTCRDAVALCEHVERSHSVQTMHCVLF